MFLESVASMPRGSVTVVVPGEGPLTDALAARGIRYTLMDFPILRRVELRTPRDAFRFLLRFIAGVRRLYTFLRVTPYDSIYLSTVIAPVWIYAGRLARKRVLVHVHESEPGLSPKASRLLLWPLRSASQVVANSFDTRRWIVRSTNRRTATRTTVVYNGIGDSLPVEAGAWRARGSKHLVLVGRLSERKGQDIAIRATAQLRQRGYDVGLTLVGDCFPGYEHVVDGLEQLVAELGLGDYVSFEGFQNPAPYVGQADVVLVPSRVEPFGLVAAEALMMGRPTVVSRVGGLPEIVTDGVTGLTVEPDDPSALADAVTDLLDHPERAAEMGRKGREDALARFSIEDYGRRFREALDF